MSGSDSAWLRMEDPTNLMTVVAVMTFRERLDADALRRVIEDRLLVHDRFRQRAVETPGRLGKPHWQDVDTFRLDDHFHAVELPSPADERALQEFVGDVMGTPLDRTRPLWHLYHVRNYGPGAAVVARLHHCMGDGVALTRLVLSLADSGETDVASPQGGIPRRAHTVAGLVRTAGSAVATLGKLAGIGLVRDPPNALKGELGLRKRAVWSGSVPLDEVKAIGRALGATVNDVLCTAVTGALRAYLERYQPVRPDLSLRAVVPVNMRPVDATSDMGNRFGLVFLPLPVGARRAVDRLRELRRRMNGIKRSGEAAVVYGLLRFLGSTAAAVEMGVVNLLGRHSTAVMTNVPGPRQPLYLCGRRIEDLIFWVPRSGRLALGVSILSYAGSVRVGIATDRQVIQDPDAIVTGFHEALDELRRAASETPGPPSPEGRGGQGVRPEGRRAGVRARSKPPLSGTPSGPATR
jgi:WS/DGAT/MGAT family acyltransferase